MIPWWIWPAALAVVLAIAIPGGMLAAWIEDRPYRNLRNRNLR